MKAERRKDRGRSQYGVMDAFSRFVWIILPLLLTFVSNSYSRRIEFNVSSSDGNPQRRDFYRKLIVTTVLENPYMMLKPHSPFLAANDRFEGYLADILLRLATSAGFQYEIRLARDGKYGDLNPTAGQWDGMIGEVMAGEADIAAGAIIVTDGKRDFVDFTESFLSLRSSALLRKPKSKRRSERINDVDQLLASNVPYGVVENSAAHRILATSSDQLKRTLWNRIAKFKPSGIVANLQEGIDRARRGNYALIFDSPMAEYVSTRKPCDLYASEPFLDAMNYAFAMRRDDHRLRNVIDKELQKMKASDEMQNMYLRWWRNECEDSVKKEEEKQIPEPKQFTVENSRSTNSALISRSSGAQRLFTSTPRLLILLITRELACFIGITTTLY